jgi:hypothetical protein
MLSYVMFSLSDTALPGSSRYSFMVSKQSNLFRCTCWYQDLNLNFIEATLSSAVSTVMLRQVELVQLIENISEVSQLL